jgi:hypothetical protein
MPNFVQRQKGFNLSQFALRENALFMTGQREHGIPSGTGLAEI